MVINRPEWKITESAIRISDVPDTVLNSMQAPNATVSKFVNFKHHADKPILSAKKSAKGTYKVVLKLEEAEKTEI